MSEQKHRPLSTNDDEIRILKETFADDSGQFQLLRIVRNLFLGFSITQDEANLVKSTFKNPNVKLALRKKMYPILASDMEVGQEMDFWFGTETEIIDKMPETINQIVMSKHRCLGMLEVALNLLDNPAGIRVSLDYNPIATSNDPFQIGLLARNKYVKSVVTGLAMIKAIAGQKSENVEQAKKRLLADSTK